MKGFSPLPGLILLIAFSTQVVPGQKRQAVRPAPSKLKSMERDVTPATPSTREEAILDEINLARSNPSRYVRYLQDFRRYYHGNEIRLPDGQSLTTHEGVKALDEAVNFLRSLRPLSPLELRTGMVVGARDHLSDLVRSGRSGHKGSDGSLPEDRVSRYGTWSESVGENIIYHSSRPREDVISLIIDDGVANRGHRKNIFKPTFHVIGIALSQPLKSSTLGVITFAGGLTPHRKS
jgi:uncharacterized protein YkwD